MLFLTGDTGSRGMKKAPLQYILSRRPACTVLFSVLRLWVVLLIRVPF